MIMVLGENLVPEPSRQVEAGESRGGAWWKVNIFIIVFLNMNIVIINIAIIIIIAQ